MKLYINKASKMDSYYFIYLDNNSYVIDIFVDGHYHSLLPMSTYLKNAIIL